MGTKVLEMGSPGRYLGYINEKVGNIWGAQLLTDRASKVCAVWCKTSDSSTNFKKPYLVKRTQHPLQSTKHAWYHNITGPIAMCLLDSITSCLPSIVTILMWLKLKVCWILAIMISANSNQITWGATQAAASKWLLGWAKEARRVSLRGEPST